MTEIKTQCGYIDVSSDEFGVTIDMSAKLVHHYDNTVLVMAGIAIDLDEELRSVLDKHITRYWRSQLARDDAKWILQGYCYVRTQANGRSIHRTLLC